MLKIGIVQSAYCNKYGFEKGIEKMRIQGYDGMDYQEFVNTETALFEKNHFEFETYLKEQKKATQNAGIEIYQAHGPWRWPPKDASVLDREERLEKMIRSIEGAAILGCNKLVIHPLMPYTIEDEEHKKGTYDINLEFMRKLCNAGQKNGVVVCLENMPMLKFSLGSISEIFEFVKIINSDYFKVCLDTGHCTMFEMSPGDGVRMLGKEYLYSLHIHDNNGLSDLHNTPFNGVIDWNDFGHALYEIGYQGVISLECQVSHTLPEKLLAYEEEGLYNKAKYIATLASGKNE